jgi:peptidoglycan/xylan/chitin deacetylase (PgdA/CDA1 family)
MSSLSKHIAFAFPQWKNRSFLLSYDDGHQSDRKIVDIFNQNNLKATFHINSHLLDDCDYRLNGADLPALYAGHEISCHGARHAELNILPKEILISELLENRKMLEGLFQKPVRGFSYPCGAYSLELAKTIENLGFAYARGIETDQSMVVPDNFFTTSLFSWLPTASSGSDFIKIGKQFLGNNPGHPRLTHMLIWGHSSDFDRNGRWAEFEDLCQMMGDALDEIWSTTMIDYIDYIAACRSLQCSVTGEYIYNPTALDLYLTIDGEQVLLKAGEQR